MDQILSSEILQAMMTQISTLVGGYVPQLVGGVLLLVVGWLASHLIAALVRRGLRKLRVDERISQAWQSEDETVADETTSLSVERLAGRAVYIVLLLVVLIAFFQVMGLTQITGPFSNMLEQILFYLPGLAGAAVLVLIAWFLATILRLLAKKLLNTARIDERFDESTKDVDAPRAQQSDYSLERTLADGVYWLVFLFFLPAILSSLQLQGLLEPVQVLINQIVAYLPSMLAAALIFVIGWFFARMIQRIVTGLLAAAGTDRLLERMELQGLIGERKVSDLLGYIVYAIVLLPVIISGLNALQLDAITGPAKNMLNEMIGVLPDVIGAALLMIVTYIVARLVSGIVVNLLKGVGFDSILLKLGISREGSQGGKTPAEIAGIVVLTAILLFAAIEAFRMLGYEAIGQLVSQFLVFGSNVLAGLVIFSIGLYIANLAADAIRAGNSEHAAQLAWIARIAILVLAGAMGLGQMGLGAQIISTAFGIGFGAVALAAAVAFGFGGKDIAARKLEEWDQSMKQNK